MFVRTIFYKLTRPASIEKAKLETMKGSVDDVKYKTMLADTEETEITGEFYGFAAQEVQSLFPELVSVYKVKKPRMHECNSALIRAFVAIKSGETFFMDKHELVKQCEDGHYAIDYVSLVPVLVEALKSYYSSQLLFINSNYYFNPKDFLYEKTHSFFAHIILE